MKVILTIFYSLTLIASFSQLQTKIAMEFTALKCYNQVEYNSDLDQLIDSIFILHPKPFEYTTKNEFLEYVKNQKSRINNNTTVGEFYAICKSIVAKLGCSHTNINKPDNFTVPDYLYFPANPYFLDSSFIVINSLNRNLPNGTEIVSINGKSILQIKNQLSLYVSADGHNTSAITAKINSNFSFYYLLAYGFHKQFEVVTKNEQNEYINVNIQADQMQSIDRYFKSNCNESLCFEISQELNYAVMTIRTFGFYKDQLDLFKTFLDQSFDKLQTEKIEHLIIDLRGNKGGDPYCGSYLLEYLCKNEFVYFDNPPINSYSDLSINIPPKIDSFKGKVYVFTDGMCLSTTGHVCSLIKYHNMAQIFGEETGATFTCNDNSLKFTLNKTGLRTSIPRNTYSTKVDGFDAKIGIIPDIVIKPNRSHLKSQKDPLIQFVLNQIE